MDETYTKEFVYKEIESLRYLYTLKYVMRYNLTREEALDTESVAEHLYGMFLLSAYFLPLEDPERKLNVERVHKMILWHDIDEIETGDIIGYLKTEEERDNERYAAQRVIERAPEAMREEMREIREEFDSLSTPEARFVKAIDKIEPNFHLFSERGKQVMRHAKTSLEEHNRIKNPYTKDFPVIRRFAEVITETMVEQQYFREA